MKGMKAIEEAAGLIKHHLTNQTLAEVNLRCAKLFGDVSHLSTGSTAETIYTSADAGADLFKRHSRSSLLRVPSIPKLACFCVYACLLLWISYFSFFLFFLNQCLKFGVTLGLSSRQQTADLFY